MLGVDAAIANAVYNAVGVRIKGLPISAEKVLAASKRARVEKTQAGRVTGLRATAKPRTSKRLVLPAFEWVTPICCGWSLVAEVQQFPRQNYETEAFGYALRMA